jgi:hypothetical protein
MKRMLTEVLWRVNVRAMRNSRNPVVYAYYQLADAFPRTESAGILSVKIPHRPVFLAKESVK